MPSCFVPWTYIFQERCWTQTWIIQSRKLQHLMTMSTGNVSELGKNKYESKDLSILPWRTMKFKLGTVRLRTVALHLSFISTGWFLWGDTITVYGVADSFALYASLKTVFIQMQFYIFINGFLWYGLASLEVFLVTPSLAFLHSH